MSYKSLYDLQKSLIQEAINSPQLLSDLAGLETYVSESYTSRSFIELLQNADDANANSFYVKQLDSFVIVANNGRQFTLDDIESLCRSASSNKTPGKTIGYRGIGFKSVVSITKEVHLFSGDYEISFSKDRTKTLIKNATRVPLIRIPHDIDSQIKLRFSNEIEHLKSQGYNTFFIFTGVQAQYIVDEYTSFSRTMLLFLNKIKNIIVELGNTTTTAQVLLVQGDTHKKQLRIEYNGTPSEWLVYNSNKCNIAFSIKDEIISRLPKNEAVIHAFLPTEDCCGLGVIINGDFSTDPSRRHLIFDEKTQNIISSCADLYKNIFLDHLFNNHSGSALFVEALIPYFDLKLVQFMKPSFERELSKHLIDSFKPYIGIIKLSPPWLNSNDYYKVMAGKSGHVITPACCSIPGFATFIKNLGVKVDDIQILLKSISKSDISILGYAQLAVAAIRQINLNHVIDNFVNMEIFVSQNQISSLHNINSNNEIIDESFIQLMIDNGLSKQDIKNCFDRLSLDFLCNRQFMEDSIQSSEVKEPVKTKNSFEKVTDWFNKTNIELKHISDDSTPTHRWRSAEENTMKVLNANGFILVDVSKQNVGYDLEGKDPNGNDICIEIKSIEFPGQKFRITNNEYAAAQFNHDKYFIAIVLQKGETIDISLIKDPTKNLRLNRQCVQWVWECSKYEFKPMSFSLK